MIEEVLVCSINEYSFNDNETGKLIEGATVWVVPLSSDDEYTKGSKPQKYSMKLEQVQQFKSVELPVLADMHLKANISRNTLTLKGFDNFKEFGF